MALQINQWKEKLSANKLILFFFGIIFLLYLLPTFIQVAFDEDLRIDTFYVGLPGIVSGDEPHYLVTTTSIINDHDYYINNNYDNAYFHGACDVGFRYINSTNPTIWRHIQMVAPEQRRAFPINMSKLHEDNLDGSYAELVKELQRDHNLTDVRQVSNRPIGLPLFSSLFLWPFKDTCFIEQGVIYLSLVISLIGLTFFFLTCLYYLQKYRKIEDKKLDEYDKENIYLALFFTTILALCTQYWYYSKTYFTEPYLTAFLLIAYYLCFIKKQNFLPGLLIGIGFSMKYPFGIYLPLFGILILLEKEWKRILYFILGASGPIIIVFYYSWLLSGQLFNSAQAGQLFFGNYFYGIFVWTLNPTFGLLPFAPFLVFSIFGLRWLWEHDRKTCITLFLVIVPYFLFWTSYIFTQFGAGAYSARYLIPLLGFLVLLCMIWYQQNQNKILFWIFLILLVISLLINIQAAFLYPLFSNNPPWIIADILRYKWTRVIEIWNKL